MNNYSNIKIIIPGNTEEKPPFSELINEIPELKLLFPYSDEDFEELINKYKHFNTKDRFDFFNENKLIKENGKYYSPQISINHDKLKDYIIKIVGDGYENTINYIEKTSINIEHKILKLKEFLRILNFSYLPYKSTKYETYEKLFNYLTQENRKNVDRLLARFSYELSESNEIKSEIKSKNNFKKNENDSDENKTKHGYSTIWNNIINIKNKEYQDSIREKFNDFRESLELDNKLTSKTRYENFLNLLTNGNFKKTSIIDWFDANDLKCFLDYLLDKKVFLQPRGVISDSKKYFTIKGDKITNLSNSARGKSKKEKEIKNAIDILIENLINFI